jgi:hypothetical protein
MLRHAAGSPAAAGVQRSSNGGSESGRITGTVTVSESRQGRQTLQAQVVVVTF